MALKQYITFKVISQLFAFLQRTQITHTMKQQTKPEHSQVICSPSLSLPSLQVRSAEMAIEQGKRNKPRLMDEYLQITTGQDQN